MPTASHKRLKSRVVATVGAGDPSALASELVLERIPYVFKNSWEAYRSWRRELGGLIDIDPCDIFITGSGAVGVSLSPHKRFAFYGVTSDIDVAIISPHHFDAAWRCLRATRRTSVTWQEWNSVKAHMENYIYWGCIATDKILHLLPFGTEWLSALTHMEGLSPADGRAVTARIYRDARSLRDYTAFTLRTLKASLAEAA